MSIFKNGIFIKSVDKMENRPEKYLNEVLFVGKSNVGKSTLINLLVNNKKLAYTSSKPGHTKLLNYYLINNSFYFVDCPGYGFSSKKGKDYIEYGKIVEDYFNDNKNLKLIVFLLDSRHEPTEDDVDFFNFINNYNYEHIIVMTKCDKLNQSERARILKNLTNKLGDIDDIDVINVSQNDRNSIENLSLLISTFVGEKNGTR